MSAPERASAADHDDHDPALDEVREHLLDRAHVHEDPASYRSGVVEALEAIEDGDDGP